MTNSPLLIKRIRNTVTLFAALFPVFCLAAVLYNGDYRSGDEIINEWYHSRTVTDKDAQMLSMALTNDPQLIKDTERLKLFLYGNMSKNK